MTEHGNFLIQSKIFGFSKIYHRPAIWRLLIFIHYFIFLVFSCLCGVCLYHPIFPLLCSHRGLT